MTPAQERRRRVAIRGAALDYVEIRAERDALSPRAAAEAAWYPGHRLGSIEAIEALIIRQREQALAALRAKQSPVANLPLAA
jgi:hypothetical protein